MEEPTLEPQPPQRMGWEKREEEEEEEEEEEKPPPA